MMRASPGSMAQPKLSTPAQLTAVYAILSMAWIVGSDAIVTARHGGDWDAMAMNTAKGALYVAVTAAALYLLARRLVSATNQMQAELLVERSTANERLARLNRVHATLTRANQSALNTDDPAQLCREICHALVDHAGMKLAWIGWLDPSTQRIVPEECAGQRDYLDGIVISADPSAPESMGPSARCLINGHTIICQDIAHTHEMQPWHTRARRAGFRCSAAVPIVVAGGRRGSLALYAEEPGYFTAEITALVEQLARDLQHGLEVIAVRREMQAKTEALALSEQRWQAALEGVGDGVWDWNIETGAVYFSPRLLEMLGYERQDFQGRISDWEQRVHPDDIGLVHDALERYLSGELADYACEHRLRCKDGNYLWILDRGKVVARDADGRPKRMIGTHADISARKAAERQLTLVQAALQATPTGIVITDQAGRIEWVNPAFTVLTGYAAEEVIGQNPRVLRSGRHDARFYDRMWRTISGGEVWRGEIFNRRKDGAEYAEFMTIAPVRTGSGTITHFVAIKQDVTEQRRLEHQLLRAQRLEGIGMLASGIAHDLNNVLAPILLSIELLKMRAGDPGMHSSLAMIESAAKRGAGIVRQVLTFARGVDGERMPLRPKDVITELNTILSETLPRQLEIVRQVAPDVPMVLGDPTQMHQMLLNLAINARDAMEAGGGRLTLAAAPVRIEQPRPTVAGLMPEGDYVAFRVQDTGGGIEPKVAEHLFEPFFTTKPRGKGTGLGLATTLGIVRSHNGFIEMETSSQGTTFSIYLPALPAERGDSNPPLELPTLRGEGRLLLICDDEQSIRELTVAIFESRGFRTITAVDGIESLRLFREHRTELTALVLDLMMPGLTGQQVLVEVRREAPQMPVLLSSGLMSEGIDLEQWQQPEAGPIGAVHKPYTAQALLAALERLLAPRAR